MEWKKLVQGPKTLPSHSTAMKKAQKYLTLANEIYYVDVRLKF